MSCENIREMLSAYMDKELDPGYDKQVEQHLKQCLVCFEYYDELKRTDLQVRTEITPIRKRKQELADKISGELRKQSEPREWFPRQWIPLRFVSAMAGVLVVIVVIFLLALKNEREKSRALVTTTQETMQNLMLKIIEKDSQTADARDSLSKMKQDYANLMESQGAERAEMAKAMEEREKRLAELSAEMSRLRDDFQALAARQVPQPDVALGVLVCALGPVELGSVEMGENKEPVVSWGACGTGDRPKAQSFLRTKSGGKASFMLRDGSEVRLNQDTVVNFNEVRELTLQSGEMWIRVKQEPGQFVVHTRDGQVVVTGTEIDVRVDKEKTVLGVLEGEAVLKNKTGRQVRVKRGEAAITAANTAPYLNQYQQIDQMSRWTLDLLMARGRDDPELLKKVNDLLVQMGESKAAYMSEEEIRSYGTACVIPLARFIDDPKSKDKPEIRNRAIKILSDIGDWYAVSTMINLLDDENNAKYASSALKRVTGQDFGSDKSKWTQWWTDHRAEHVSDNLDKVWEKVKKKLERDK